MKISLTFLLLALGSALSYPSPVTQHNGHLMYPYGEAEGDQKTPKDDDGTSPRIYFEQDYDLFNKTYRDGFVNNNGVFSFGEPVSEYTPKRIPLTEGEAFVAPFWADVNNELGGDIYYRQVKDPKLLDRLTKDINEYYPEIPFNAIWALIATWDRVAYFGSTSNKTNTFQAILTTDATTSFVIFNYDKIEWTTGTASGGDPKTGLGGYAAQAGMNSGDDENYYSIPGSRRREIINITQTSNVHKPGCWVFQMNHFKPTGIPEELMELTVPEEEEPQAPLEEEPQAPVEEEPQAPIEEAPKEEEPKAPIEEAPKEEEPKAPIEEAPKEEEPKAPIEEAPKEEEPKAPIEEKPKAPEEEEPQETPMDYEEDDDCEEYED